MITRLHLAAVAVAAGLSFAAPAWSAEDHSHSGHAGLSELTLNHGAKWQTDAPLRQGMESILHDFAKALPQIHDGKMSEHGYAELAEKVHHQLEYMFANCKLPAEADAQLHIVLAQVMDGTETMKAGPERMSGAVRIVQALDAYGRHFDHSGWTPLKH